MYIYIDNVNLTLDSFPIRELEKVIKKFTMFAPGYKYSKLYKRKLWDGKLCLFKKDSCTIPTGLLPEVLNIAPHATIVDKRNINSLQLNSTNIKLRDYQQQAIKQTLGNSLYNSWWPRGVIKIATGGGKTIVAAAMIHMTNVKTLFIVHTRDLVAQTVEKFQDAGIEVGTVIGSTVNLDPKVVVATIQSLMSWSHKSEKGHHARQQEKAILIKTFLSSVEQVFVDEAHLCAGTMNGANTFVRAMNLMPNAYMRWGLTATPFMREEYQDQLLEGVTGQILYEISSKDLIHRGYLATPKITMYRMKVKTFGDWKEDYDIGVVSNSIRNKKIVECIKTLSGPIMVLVKRISHGDELKRLCVLNNLPVLFLHGHATLEERREALKELVTGQIKAVIASTIWDTGLDVAEIRTLILAGAGKSKVKNLQRLGRGLRPTTEKTSVAVIDFFEEGSRWLRSHAVQRRKLWTSEGFEVRIE